MEDLEYLSVCSVTARGILHCPLYVVGIIPIPQGLASYYLDDGGVPTYLLLLYMLLLLL